MSRYYSNRGWNRCSDCNRFRRPEDLTDWEHICIADIHGTLHQEWGFECKAGRGCKTQQKVAS